MTTALALVGYYVFPVMPPRLVPFLGFRDTMITHPSPWRVSPIPIWNIGNPYAAMPSLHVAWSIWVCMAVLATTRSLWIRSAACAYPFVTMVAIVGTGNHYVLDAVGGGLVVILAMVLLPVVSRATGRRWLPQLAAHPSASLPGDDDVAGYSPPLWGNSSKP
ncbi:MAG: phosphatase PAP2 family protein [Ilumatobacteraceae bacterium]